MKIKHKYDCAGKISHHKCNMYNISKEDKLILECTRAKRKQ